MKELLGKVQNFLTETCSPVHESRFTDLTRETWTPRFRWIPAHRMHRKIPRFHDAHLGPAAT